MGSNLGPGNTTLDVGDGMTRQGESGVLSSIVADRKHNLWVANREFRMVVGVVDSGGSRGSCNGVEWDECPIV